MIRIPDMLIFMKVGSHAGENWERILERKRKELADSGLIYWGYGGGTCHPISQVQPFARLAIQAQGQLALVMVPIDSRARPEIVPATQFSRDGVLWEPIPAGVNVIGSRYAFVLDEIAPIDLEIDLGEFEVGIGPSRGKPADYYVHGRVDKACLARRRSRARGQMGGCVHNIGFKAALRDPFAVLLR